MEATDDSSTSIVVSVPRRDGYVFQVQNIKGTDVWAVVEKDDLNEVLLKARLYDTQSIGAGSKQGVLTNTHVAIPKTKTVAQSAGKEVLSNG